ncbi:MAG TPA: lysylphosphatidylglycerol synthase transmembrane domain-containing protein [Anaeromyxobacter sp.]
MRRGIQVGAGLAVSAAALWLTLRGKDPGAIWGAMRAGDYRYLVPYVVALFVIHLLRTVRWGLLLRPIAAVPFARLNAVSAVGFMALVILPFRLGELARPILVAERPRLRTSAALSSIVVERAADGLFTGLLLVVALLAVPDGTPGVRLLRVGGALVSLAFAAIIGFLAFAYRNRAGAVAFATRLVRPLSPRLAERAGGMLDAFIHGLRVLPGPRSLVLFVVLTAGYWLLNAVGMRVLALGFGFDLGAAEACALLGVLVVGVMIPAGPGMIGTFQGAIVLGLSLFAPPDAVATRGMAYANVLWAAQLAQVTALGLAFLFSRHVPLGRLWGAAGEVGAGLEAEEAEYRSAGDGAP